MNGKRNAWMRYVLIAAGLYNIAWGLSVVMWPMAVFHLTGVPEPSYPELWQAIGVLIAIFGAGYAIASVDPLRYWPVVCMGLMGNILAPASLAAAALRGRFPLSFGWPILANDLVWCVPFGLILKSAWDEHLAQRRAWSPDVLSLALRARTDAGMTLEQMSRVSPVVVVFLRHAGCTFCREALADLAAQRREIQASGAQIVLVHMGEAEFGREFFAKYGLDHLPQISDPARTLYRAFGLRRGSLPMLIGPRVWIRGFDAAILRRHGFGRWVGDAFQMPGVFLLFHGQILRSYRHQSASDRPNYVRFAGEDLEHVIS